MVDVISIVIIFIIACYWFILLAMQENTDQKIIDYEVDIFQNNLLFNSFFLVNFTYLLSSWSYNTKRLVFIILTFSLVL